LPLLATQVIEASAKEVGILFTIYAIIVMVMGIPKDMLTDRVAKKR